MLHWRREKSCRLNHLKQLLIRQHTIYCTLGLTNFCFSLFGSRNRAGATCMDKTIHGLYSVWVPNQHKPFTCLSIFRNFTACGLRIALYSQSALNVCDRTCNYFVIRSIHLSFCLLCKVSLCKYIMWKQLVFVQYERNQQLNISVYLKPFHTLATDLLDPILSFLRWI